MARPIVFFTSFLGQDIIKKKSAAYRDWFAEESTFWNSIIKQRKHVIHSSFSYLSRDFCKFNFEEKAITFYRSIYKKEESSIGASGLNNENNKDLNKYFLKIENQRFHI